MTDSGMLPNSVLDWLSNFVKNKSSLHIRPIAKCGLTNHAIIPFSLVSLFCSTQSSKFFSIVTLFRNHATGILSIVPIATSKENSLSY